jgi:anti-sigma B factor antagonist
MSTDPQGDVICVEHRGDVTILEPTQTIETLRWDLIEQAAQMVLAPIRAQPGPVLVDLSAVNYFGSVFLSLLLRCWKVVSARGATMVLCCVSPQARELLRVTALDTLWAIYDTRQQAMEVLESD